MDQKFRILVIDDDPDILFAMDMLLKHHGFEVEVESSGEEAIARVNAVMPDLVILDVMLGGVDGRDICKVLKNSTATHQIPIIMFSANNTFSTVMQSCNADDFIAKPFDFNFMVERINKHLGNIAV